MDRVFDSFERTIILSAQHPDWFDWRDQKLERILGLYNDGYLKVLNHHDSEGRRIVIANNNVNMNKYDADDIFRLHYLVFVLISHEEESQFCGISYILDANDRVTMKYLSMFPINSMYDYATTMMTAPIRMKSIFFVGLPSFASNFATVLKLGLSNKMKKRFMLLKNRKELFNHYDKKIFTKDFGGDVDEREVVDEFLKTILDEVEYNRLFFAELEVDIDKAIGQKKMHENVGCFRQIEID